MFSFKRTGDHRDLHSFPTRRSSDLTYEEIALKGGVILNSAARLQEMDEDTLFEEALERIHELAKYGTGAIEIKSGYGLSVEGELKMLRVIKRLKAEIGRAHV